MVVEKLNEKKILNWLAKVTDPEIPVVSLIDLGVIQKVEIDNAEHVKVTMTPTFVGCPATSQMKLDIEECLRSQAIASFEVNISMKTPWSSNQITDIGRQKLKEFGLAPPQKLTSIVDLDVLQRTPCPFCNSDNTELKTPFGPTLCRAMHYCHNCQQAFEQFKPVG